MLAPFHSLIGDAQNNVLLGLRIVEKVEYFPEPTAEELKFFQLSLGGKIADISESKTLFKKWVIVNGFEDIHKCLRVTLERLYILKTAEKQIHTLDPNALRTLEEDLRVKASNFYFDALVNAVNATLANPLKYRREIESFNNARNCLVHTNGFVTPRHCNNGEKNRLTICGNRFRLFFKRNEIETIAEIGGSGPENAALMLGAEQFQIEFSLGERIQLDLKQFLDILNSCIFIKADIEDKLNS